MWHRSIREWCDDVERLFQRQIKMIELLLIWTKYIFMSISKPSEIITSAQWHAWFNQRRDKLKHRLEQAEQAEWNWPSTRRRCEVMRLEDELRALDAEEFVVPSFGQDRLDQLQTI